MPNSNTIKDALIKNNAMIADELRTNFAKKSDLDYNNLSNTPDLTVYATKTELNGYIKNNDTSYTPTIRGKGVYVKGDEGAAYTTTIYGDGSISRSIPRTPGYTYTMPDKSGTFAMTDDVITSYNDLTDKPSIPTKTSDLTNDSSFIDSTQLSSTLTDYAKLNDDTQNITANSITVTPGGGYIHTTYDASTIHMSIPRTPGYTLNIPTKDGTLATTNDIPTYTGGNGIIISNEGEISINEDEISIKLYSHNYSGAFRCTFNSNSYIGTFTLDCISSSNGNGTTLADLKNMLSERGYYNTTITSDVPSSDVIQMYGLRTNLSLKEGSVNPGYQYPASMFLHKDNIYITINTTDNNIGNGKVFTVVEQAFSMRHLVNRI